MGDPLSGCASVIAVLQLSAAVITTAYAYLSEVKDAQKDIDKIRTELYGLDNLLHSLKVVMDSDSEPTSKGSCLRDFRDMMVVLEECSDLLRKFNKKLGEPVDKWKKLKKVKNRLLWPLTHKEVAELLSTLIRHKGTITIALQIDQKKAVAAIERNIGKVLTGVEARDREETLQWLSPMSIDVESNFKDARARFQPNTGEWFTKGSDFLTWRDRDHSPLWLHGIPGCGKTILSGTIINELKRHCSGNSSYGLAYFFFTFNNQQKRSACNMLRSLISQLCHMKSEIPCEVRQLFENKTREPNPTANVLFSVLESLSETFEPTYIVLDALDECEPDPFEKGGLSDVLSKMSESRTINLLMTSRREPNIEEALDSLRIQQIPIQNSAVDADIRYYIKERLEKDKKFQKWSQIPKVKNMIEKRLGDGSLGMFRWVQCQLDSIKDCRNERDLERALSTLPVNLDETYDRILVNIPQSDSEFARNALMWLAFAARPMTIEELAEAVVVNPGTTHIEPSTRFLDSRELLTICGSLVTFSDESKTASLAHYSVKEYLVSERIRKPDTEKFAQAMQNATGLVAEICLTYLLFDEFKTVRDYYANLRRLQEYPLLRYAAEFWVKHIQDTSSEERRRLESLAFYLMAEENKLKNWIWAVQKDGYSSSVGPPLYYTSYYGLPAAVEKQLQEGANVNARWEGGHKLALIAAAAEGHDSTVKILLDKGADVNARSDSEFGTALEAAAACSHNSTILLLLEKGADINAQSSSQFGFALAAASAYGHDLTVELLLEKGAEVNAYCEAQFGFALAAAAACGHDSTVRLLLREGANITAALSPHYGTALAAAASNGHVQTALLLIQEGADFRTQFKLRYGTALATAAANGHVQMVKLLLEKGADVNTQTCSYFGTALEAATSNGHVSTVLQILEKGADVNAQSDSHYGNALATAAACSHDSVVLLLLDNGAAVNTQSKSRYATALIVAAAYGRNSKVRLLLERGADVNAQCSPRCCGSPRYYGGNPRYYGGNPRYYGGNPRYYGGNPRSCSNSHCCDNPRPCGNPRYCGTALAAAAAKGHDMTVRLLIERGADFNARFDSQFGTALATAAGNGHISTVRLLLDSGARINVQAGVRYGTALAAAASNGFVPMVNLLLNRDAHVNAQSNSYFGNALEAAAAASKGHGSAILLLLEKGAEVNAQSASGYATALATAAAYGHDSAVQLLIDRGADVNLQAGSRYGTALAAAATQGRDSTVRLLLKNGADIKTKSNSRHGTALAAAAYGNRNSTVLLLLENGAEVDTQAGLCHGTALATAAALGHISIVELLLNKGADVNLQSESPYGFALAAAAAFGHDKVVSLLLRKGSKIDARSNCKHPTALAAARSGKHVLTARLLLREGASDTSETTDLATVAEKDQEPPIKMLHEGTRINTAVEEVGEEPRIRNLPKIPQDGQHSTAPISLHNVDCAAQFNVLNDTSRELVTAPDDPTMKFLFQNGLNLSFDSKGFVGTAMEVTTDPDGDSELRVLFDRGPESGNPNDSISGLRSHQPESDASSESIRISKNEHRGSAFDAARILEIEKRGSISGDLMVLPEMAEYEDSAIDSAQPSLEERVRISERQKAGDFLVAEREKKINQRFLVFCLAMSVSVSVVFFVYSLLF